MVIQKSNKWWFYDETGTRLIGPYDSEAEATKEINQYRKELEEEE